MAAEKNSFIGYSFPPEHLSVAVASDMVGKQRGEHASSHMLITYTYVIHANGTVALFLS